MKNLKIVFIVIALFLAGCTSTGKLYYFDSQGDRKLACDIEFIGNPTIDKYAVEYSLSLCAKAAVKKGYKINETYLLEINTTIPNAPCGRQWSHKLVKEKYTIGELTKKEYGYIIAYIDLGLATTEQCSPNKKSR
ncbi:hypothetical protein P3339_08250 [Microbulbifer sp. MLAF003]|uniref:hypothetical protein n=1 Tax=unclassified Microbulbifer TaxID=2619833 RepID=UPI0024AE70EF|nr:hypothetical protein [Microbulbifer sp. MLAF003]WHI52740.1 hypothetical protein P3339_08250 [Microbulbifer sp. MLAF003]